ncbi:alpha/beta fold hydrolase [Cellulomonas sp. URHD0024]|uniref:alpha/beta fold hydrolase n=1 Tax=Cellulomonas sp. URHD0024 TaxID=1302620 RepID=UPI0003FBE464|nr:alpha/beta hydrolase [Cellulomonas sp. URHD0024]
MNHVRVHTLQHVGPHHEPPVFVLVHGIGASHRYFRRLQHELAGRGDTHAVDLPGFGGSPRPRRALSIEQLASALGDRLDDLGGRRAVVVGHSMGVQVAVALALVRPELVSHVVLLGPVTDPDRATALTQARDLCRDAVREPVSGNALLLADFLRCGPRWYVAELPAMLTYPLLDAVRHVRCPVLVVRGSRDPVARGAWAARVSGAAGNGRLVEVPGARHLVQHTDPQRTAAAIGELVESRSCASPPLSRRPAGTPPRARP